MRKAWKIFAVFFLFTSSLFLIFSPSHSLLLPLSASLSSTLSSLLFSPSTSQIRYMNLIIIFSCVWLSFFYWIYNLPVMANVIACDVQNFTIIYNKLMLVFNFFLFSYLTDAHTSPKTMSINGSPVIIRLFGSSGKKTRRALFSHRTHFHVANALNTAFLCFIHCSGVPFKTYNIVGNIWLLVMESAQMF